MGFRVRAFLLVVLRPIIACCLTASHIPYLAPPAFRVYNFRQRR